MERVGPDEIWNWDGGIETITTLKETFPVLMNA